MFAEAALPGYQAIVMDDHGTVSRVEAFRAADDRAACEAGRQFITAGQFVEVWRRGARVEADVAS